VPGPRPDPIRSPPLERWMDSRDDSRLASHVASQSRIPVTEARPAPRPGTSMMMSGPSSLAGCTTGSSATSQPSVSSSMGGRVVHSRLLELDIQGALQVPPLRPTVFECPFNHLQCRRTFTRYSEWYAHSLEHFLSAGPPKFNRCCFCDKTFQQNDSNQSWRERMQHIATHHQLGHRLATARPDFELFQYLWQKKIIDDPLYKELMGGSHGPVANPYPSPPTSPQSASSANSFETVFTETHRPRGSRANGQRR